MICPDCNRIHKNKLIHDVYNNGLLTCPCQDGWSYPNKFMYSLLEQIGVDFQAEKIFDWSDGRKYDDYIEYKKKSKMFLLRTYFKETGCFS